MQSAQYILGPLLGEDRPRGGKRVLWNTLALTALGLATFGAGWAVWDKVGWYGVGGTAAFVALALFVHFVRVSQRGR